MSRMFRAPSFRRRDHTGRTYHDPAGGNRSGPSPATLRVCSREECGSRSWSATDFATLYSIKLCVLLRELLLQPFDLFP